MDARAVLAWRVACGGVPIGGVSHMLTIHGRKQGGFCDGVSRRGFLRIGALGLGAAALNLRDIYAAEDAQRSASPHKAVIHVFLGGGPPHQDMWDIKSEAPVEVRGEFAAIPTTTPGVQIGEVFPGIASRFDKFAAIRTVVGVVDRHEPYQVHTGWRRESLAPLGGRPALGSAIARLQGPVEASVPPFVGLANVGVWKDPGTPGYLGPTYSPFQPDGPGMANMTLNDVTLERLGDRKRLRSSFDQFRSIVDHSGKADAMDSLTQRGARCVDLQQTGGRAGPLQGRPPTCRPLRRWEALQVPI